MSKLAISVMQQILDIAQTGEFVSFERGDDDDVVNLDFGDQQAEIIVTDGEGATEDALQQINRALKKFA